MISGTLVHDTGTMIRFRTRQLGDLPDVSCEVELSLPTGRVVRGHFNSNRRNPNVSGRDLVQYIKRRLALGEREDVLVEQRRPDWWIVHLLSPIIEAAQGVNWPLNRIETGRMELRDFSALMALADREGARQRRIGAYARILRPSGLRCLILGTVDVHECMVHQCDAVEQFTTNWGGDRGLVIVEVHHIEPLARVIDHHPRNLCILCANHHRFIHGVGSWRVRHEGPDVILTRPEGEIVVCRPAAFE